MFAMKKDAPVKARPWLARTFAMLPLLGAAPTCRIASFRSKLRLQKLLAIVTQIRT